MVRRLGQSQASPWVCFIPLATHLLPGWIHAYGAEVRRRVRLVSGVAAGVQQSMDLSRIEQRTRHIIVAKLHTPMLA